MIFYPTLRTIHDLLNIPHKKLVDYDVAHSTPFPVNAVRTYLLATYRNLKAVRWQMFFRTHGGPLHEDCTTFGTDIPRSKAKLYVRTKLINARITFGIVGIQSDTACPSCWQQYIGKSFHPTLQPLPDLLAKIIERKVTQWVTRDNVTQVRSEAWGATPVAPDTRVITYELDDVRVTVSGPSGQRMVTATTTGKGGVLKTASVHQVESLIVAVGVELKQLAQCF